MNKVLGLNKGNLDRYLKNYTDNNLTLIELIEVHDTNFLLSENYLQIKLKGLDTFLVKKDEALVMFKSLDLDLDNDDLNKRNVIAYPNIEIYPELLDDLTLVNNFIIINNRKQTKELLTRYNQNEDAFTEDEKISINRMITMAELELDKELVVLEVDSKIPKNIVYLSISVGLSNNELEPTAKILDMYNSDIEKNILIYQESYLTLDQFMRIVNTMEPEFLRYKRTMKNFNMNSEYLKADKLDKILRI